MQLINKILKQDFLKNIFTLITGTSISQLIPLLILPLLTRIFSPNDFNLKSPKENGKTFLENSLIKAKYFSKKIGKICLADDSGLEIDILNKAPGIYSARWGGKKKNFNVAIKKVFKELGKVNQKWRTKKIKARFICALSIYWPNNKSISVLGKIEGHISKIKLGNNGFGYDPIFIPSNNRLTFAQMKPSEKI